MKGNREVWFAPAAIRGFGIVHWKGPVFIVAMALVGLLAALVVLVNEDSHPVLAVIGAAGVISAIVIGSNVCALHTVKDS